MKSVNKFLLLGISLLLVVIMLELVYYRNFLTKSIVTNDSNLTPVKAQSTDSSQYATIYERLLLAVSKGIVDSIIETQRFSGYIIDLDTSGGVTQVDKFPYQLMITLSKDKNSNNSFPFYFNKQDLVNFSIVSAKTNQDLSLNDLEIGNKITIERKIDILKNYWDNTLSVIIIK